MASSQLDNEERKGILNLLSSIFEKLTNRGYSIEKEFDVYRGDSFQALLKKTVEALKIALYTRLKLIANQDQNHPHNWDARIAVGIGEISYWGENASTSDGSAFRNSGPILDEMKGAERLKIAHWEAVEELIKRFEYLLEVV